MQYRKKPVVIEAVQVTKGMGGSNWKGLPEWLRNAYEEGDILFLNDGVEIKTLEGTMKADIDDFIIQGVQGELYPCKPDIFKQTYDECEPNHVEQPGKHCNK